MAGFESTRIAPVVEAAKEWRIGRFAPLYAAGILAGVALGIGVATWPTEAAGTHAHVAPPPAAETHIVDEIPVFAPAPVQIDPAVPVPR